MRRMKTERRDVEVLDAIWCDMCGTEIIDYANCGHNFARLYATWGYGSRRDGDEIDFDLCEHCVYDRIQPMLTEAARAKM